MKASHRKDVIIARLIFAAICLFLIALIATIVITVTSKGGKKKEQDKVQQNAIKPLSSCIPPSDTRICAADAQTAARSANKIPVPSKFKITVPTIMSAIAI